MGRLLFKVSALAAKMQEDVAVSGEKLRTRLGFTPGYCLAEGFERTVSARNLSSEGER